MRQPVTPDETASILRLHHVEGWPVGTIGAQLGRHHDTVERVLAQAGLGVQKQVIRTAARRPYVPFMKETLAKYPRLRASRLWSMAKARGYTGSRAAFAPSSADSGRALTPRRICAAPCCRGKRRRSIGRTSARSRWAGATRELWAFVMVLSYSRRRFVRFSLRAAMPSFLRGHVEAFRFFGAVPRVILYDNLKSAVLEREGDAVRFHPTLLGLAGHYRFEPRACAPYRPNEKGRVERAIRDVRDNFFAARDFGSVEDLNAQARAWCEEIARERRVPDAPETTCEAAFLEERSKMVALADDEFPVEERLEVRVGKTPYVRFDKNDYSVPHTHVKRSLTVVATDERVRILDPEAAPGAEVLADHPRTFDRDQRIEVVQHLRALVEEKRRAHQSRGFDRLFGAVPSSRAMMERIAERGGNLGATTSGLLQLLDRVGADTARARGRRGRRARPDCTCAPSIMCSTGCATRRVNPRRSRCRVTTDPRAAVQVRPHALSTYDRLHAATTEARPQEEEDLDTRSDIESALKRLRLFGCLARLDELENEPWLDAAS